MPLSFSNGDKLYACMMSNIVAEKMGNYVYSGLSVTPKATPTMKVDVASGVARLSYALKSISGTEVTINTAHSTYDRYDLISVSGTGTIVYTAGTAEANPYPPNLPSDHMGLAIIYVQANDNQITSGDIFDIRIVNSQVLWRDSYQWTASTNYVWKTKGENFNGSSIMETHAMSFTVPEYPKLKSGSSVKVYLKIKSTNTSTTAYARISKNGVSLGTVSTTSTSYTEKTYDVSNITNNDVISISIYSTGSSYGVYVSDISIGFDSQLVTNEY